MQYLLFLFFLCVGFPVLSQKPEVVISSGHVGSINCVAFSKDAKYFASGGADKTIKIVETASGKELRTITNIAMRVSAVKFSNDGKYLLAAIEGTSISVFDFTSGELLHEFPSGTEDFDFCLDNNKVVFVSDENDITIANYKTGVVSKTIPGYAYRLSVDPNNRSIVYTYDHKMMLRKVDLKSGSTMSEKLIWSKEVDHKFPTTKMEVSLDGEYLTLAFDGAKNGDNGSVYVYNTEDLSERGVLKGHTKRISDMTIASKSGELLTAGFDLKVKRWNLKKMKMIDEHVYPAMMFNAIQSHPTEDYYLIVHLKDMNYVDIQSGNIVRSFIPQGNSIQNMAYDQIGSYLVTSSTVGSVKLWDLEQNKVSKDFTAFWPVGFSPGGKDLVFTHGGLNLSTWDPITGKKKNTLKTENEILQKLAYSPDGKYLAGCGYQGVIKVWDTKSNKIISKLQGHVGGVYGICYSPDGKQLASSGMDQTVRIWDVSSGKEIHKIEGDQNVVISDVKYSHDGKYLASSSWDKTIVIYNTKNWSKKHVLKGHVNMVTCLDFSKDNKFLASGSGNNVINEVDNAVIVWDVEKGREHCKYEGHYGTIQNVIFDDLSSKIYSSSMDGKIKIWDPITCEEIATMASIGKDGYVVTTPDNYYMASKDALGSVAFRLGTKLYPFEQFDLKFNRPDIICSRIGKTPQGLINAYKYIYDKRLRKMGFEEEDLGDEFHLPEVKIVSGSENFTTDIRDHKFEISASDAKYKLDRINVYVNDVPIYGLQGLSVKEYGVSSMSKNMRVKLTNGVNKIQVSVHNEKGVESLRETFEVIYNGEVAQGDLYLISIGVSEYDTKEFNLKYAAKDAKDVSKILSEKNQRIYKNVKTKTLVNGAVTKESVRALENFLAVAKEDDALIIFIAGHGLLDENLDYFFATHDIDFNNPSDKGIAYEDLEALLYKVRAYQKLLIMDTCHSGELDKEEVKGVEAEDVKLGDVEFRAVGLSVVAKEGFGVDNSAELLDNMFADVRKGSGATVISSAGGAELAMESDEWKNGLFTFCLLNGLTSKSADINKDGEILVSELRSYVYDQVIQLSNGNQRPTARSQNLSSDYRIW